MRIAQIAPLYESVPPRFYGGTERVVSYLTEELVRQGHDVTLFASGDMVEYGGTAGQTQYFLTGRFFESNTGLENPTPSWNAIHDHTTQERGFGYVSTLLDPYTRFTVLGGATYARFHILNTPGLTPNFTAVGVSSFNSAPRQCAARSCRAS
jgi:hypothetical protein